MLPAWDDASLPRCFPVEDVCGSGAYSRIGNGRSRHFFFSRSTAHLWKTLLSYRHSTERERESTSLGCVPYSIRSFTSQNGPAPACRTASSVKKLKHRLHNAPQTIRRHCSSQYIGMINKQLRGKRDAQKPCHHFLCLLPRKNSRDLPRKSIERRRPNKATQSHRENT